VAAARPVSPVVIEEVLVDGVVQPPVRNGRLRVKSGGRRFEFRFTSPDLRAPERVRFRYRLEGLDGGWGDAGAERMAVFNRLRPGAYEFRVMAGGGDGNWREARPLRMVVEPRWWERQSVQAAGAGLLMAVIAASGWGFSRARLRRRIAALELQRKLECERRRIAANLHDDLGASLTRITLLSELARDDAEAGGAGEEIEQIRATAHHMGQAMDEIVWAVNPAHDTLNSLASYLGKVAQELLAPAGVRCRLALPADLPALTLGGQVRHNLYLGVKEAVHNAIKHAQASEVRLQLAVNADSFTLTITDDGRGFAPAARSVPPQSSGRISSGNGLRNLTDHLAAIGGVCVIDSRPGTGTKVRLTVPFHSLSS
jgi:signal transduction histidine kinase